MSRKHLFALSVTAVLSLFGCDDKTASPAPPAAPAPAKVAAKPPAKAVMDNRPPDPETGIIAKPSFPLRSPLSSPKVLAQRLKLPAVPTDDYKLADFHFLEFIPPGYDPKKPMGILVLVNYKPSDGLPNAILPQVSAANLAFVVAKELPVPAWQRAGLALDAVYNIQQSYKVDPRRIYIMGGGEPPNSGPNTESTAVAQRLGLAFPDIFTGTIALDAIAYRNTPAETGDRFWPAAMGRVDAQYLALAKERPVIIAPFSPEPFWQPLVHAYKADGFKHVEFRQGTPEQYHYPFYTDDWLPSMLRYLDERTKNLPLPTANPSTTRAATKPSK